MFVAIGMFYALTRDGVPAWAHLTVLAGGVWIAFRLWDAGAEHRGR